MKLPVQLQSIPSVSHASHRQVLDEGKELIPKWIDEVFPQGTA